MRNKCTQVIFVQFFWTLCVLHSVIAAWLRITIVVHLSSEGPHFMSSPKVYSKHETFLSTCIFKLANIPDVKHRFQITTPLRKDLTPEESMLAEAEFKLGNSQTVVSRLHHSAAETIGLVTTVHLPQN